MDPWPDEVSFPHGRGPLRVHCSCPKRSAPVCVGSDPLQARLDSKHHHPFPVSVAITFLLVLSFPKSKRIVRFAAQQSSDNIPRSPQHQIRQTHTASRTGMQKAQKIGTSAFGVCLESPFLFFLSSRCGFGRRTEGIPKSRL